MNILSILIQQYNTIDAIIAYKCNFVCKELHNLINEHDNWNKYKFIKKDYDNEKCNLCNLNNTIAFGKCFNCLKDITFITATDVKKKWYLNDKDLLNLNVYIKYHNVYKKNIKLFDKNEILEYSLIKYNGMKNFNKIVENKLQKSKKMRDIKLNNLKEKEERKNIRRLILSEKLKKNKLLYREDSVLCEQYINEERDDIDFIILTMQEMDYFFKNTCYRSIMSKLVDNFKSEIRDNYGHMNSKEYYELIDDEIPILSTKAKKMALKGKNKNHIPEYCIKYL